MILTSQNLEDLKVKLNGSRTNNAAKTSGQMVGATDGMPMREKDSQKA
jgi:hypothetical protein